MTNVLQQITRDWDSARPIVNGTFILVLESPWASASVASVAATCFGGSFTANVQKNGPSVPGLGDIVVKAPVGNAAAIVNATPTSGAALAPRDTLMVTISGVSTPPPANAAIQINLETSVG